MSFASNCAASPVHVLRRTTGGCKEASRKKNPFEVLIFSAKKTTQIEFYSGDKIKNNYSQQNERIKTNSKPAEKICYLNLTKAN